MIDFTTVTACGECCLGCSKKESGTCPGCIEAKGKVPEWAESGICRIHACCTEHNTRFCFLCGKFPCENLPKMIFWNPDIVNRLSELRKKYKSQIVEKMRREIITRSARFEEQTKGTKDEYNIYREHVQYVHKYVVMLSKDKNVDGEVLELAALLHDISMTDMSLDRSRHNEFGAEIAERLLTENYYPEEKTQLVKKCILNHSKRRQEYRSTEEEQILVDADGLSHFDAIKSMYSLPSKVMGLSEEDSVRFVQHKLTGDYEELSDDLKPLVKEKYDRLMAAKCAKDITGE
ncbi:MAG: HD domain-containing protein [Lachnospiraceae bacterium]|nr:HD domain-containing protein [Lachnospiraceae bacterium]